MSQHLAMPHISVESPVTHSSWDDGKYTTYDIIVNCEEDSCPLFALSRSIVSRRYREFRWLRKKLCSVSSAAVRRVPALPTVGCPLFDDRFSPEFIEKRRRGLEEFLQGVCAIPTLLSEAALHLFLQTDLTILEIDAYVDRKWGRREEVCDVIVSLNRQKQCDERDEIASLASVGRWSEASLLDLEEDVVSNESSAASSTNKHSSSAGSTVGCFNIRSKKSEPQRVQQEVSAASQVVSPVLGLYLPPQDQLDSGTRPVTVRSRRGRDGADHLPRSRSVQIRQSNGVSSSQPTSLSPGHNQLSSSFTSTHHDDPDSPTSMDIYNRRRRCKSPGPISAPKTVPYYCSNAVWLSANSNGNSGTSGATSSLSPSSITNGAPV